MRKFLADVTEITDSIAIVFGTLLALLIIFDLAPQLHLTGAWIVASMIALHGFITIVSWFLPRKAVSQE